MMELHSHIESLHYDEKATKISNLKSYYDTLNSNYNNGTFRESHKFWKLSVTNFLSQKKTGTILDYGCGTGIHSVSYADKNWFVYGIDISEKSIFAATELSEIFSKESYSQYMVMDCQKLDFSDNTFDVILDYGTFSSLDIKKALPEIIRVLKPDGVVFCIETFGHNPVTNLNRNLNVLRGKRTKWAQSHILKSIDWRWIQSLFHETSFFYFAVILPLASPLISLFPKIVKLHILTFFEKLDSFFVKVIKLWAFKTVVVLRNPKKNY